MQTLAVGIAPVPHAGTYIRWKLGLIRARDFELGCEISFQGVGEAPALMICFSTLCGFEQIICRMWCKSSTKDFRGVGTTWLGITRLDYFKTVIQQRPVTCPVA